MASIPRSGSTYVLRALAGLDRGDTTPRGFYVIKKPFDLPVVKTHSCANEVLHNDYRAIFLFRNPIQCVISTKRKRYDWKHFENCGAEYPPKVDIYDKDILKYEEKFDSWNKDNGFPVILLRYEAIPKYFDLIEEFTGRKIDFPKWKASKGNIEKKKNLKRIKRTYSSLIKKIAEMPEIKIFNWSRN